jgi:hypothetical protein
MDRNCTGKLTIGDRFALKIFPKHIQSRESIIVVIPIVIGVLYEFSLNVLFLLSLNVFILVVLFLCVIIMMKARPNVAKDAAKGSVNAAIDICPLDDILLVSRTYVSSFSSSLRHEQVRFLIGSHRGRG